MAAFKVALFVCFFTPAHNLLRSLLHQASVTGLKSLFKTLLTTPFTQRGLHEIVVQFFYQWGWPRGISHPQDSQKFIVLFYIYIQFSLFKWFIFEKNYSKVTSVWFYDWLGKQTGNSCSLFKVHSTLFLLNCYF